MHCAILAYLPGATPWHMDGATPWQVSFKNS